MPRARAILFMILSCALASACQIAGPVAVEGRGTTIVVDGYTVGCGPYEPAACEERARSIAAFHEGSNPTIRTSSMTLAAADAERPSRPIASYCWERRLPYAPFAITLGRAVSGCTFVRADDLES
jgi:hypothetical protein